MLFWFFSGINTRLFFSLVGDLLWNENRWNTASASDGRRRKLYDRASSAVITLGATINRESARIYTSYRLLWIEDICYLPLTCCFIITGGCSLKKTGVSQLRLTSEWFASGSKPLCRGAEGFICGFLLLYFLLKSVGKAQKCSKRFACCIQRSPSNRLSNLLNKKKNLTQGKL